MVYYDHNKKLLPVKKRKIALYSIKTIHKNEELFATYGDEYWTTRKVE
jgi:SET domain-containing protein